MYPGHIASSTAVLLDFFVVLVAEVDEKLSASFLDGSPAERADGSDELPFLVRPASERNAVGDFNLFSSVEVRHVTMSGPSPSGTTIEAEGSRVVRLGVLEVSAPLAGLTLA